MLFVREAGTDLGDKAPYVPEEARRQATWHASHFARLLDDVGKGQGAEFIEQSAKGQEHRARGREQRAMRKGQGAISWA